MAPLEATVSPGGCLRGTNCSFGSNDAFLSIGSHKQFIGSHEQLEFICSSLAVHLQFIGSHYQLDLRICDLQHSVCSSHVYIYIYMYICIYIYRITYIYLCIYIYIMRNSRYIDIEYDLSSKYISIRNSQSNS